jgi:hypothetical protein
MTLDAQPIDILSAVTTAAVTTHPQEGSGLYPMTAETSARDPSAVAARGGKGG